MTPTLTRLMDPAPGSPLGPLRATAGAAGIVALAFARGLEAEEIEEAQRAETSDTIGLDRAGEVAGRAHLDQLEAELAAYLAGQLQAFTVPLQPAGTAFQQRVWTALAQLPYGRTCSYAALTAALGLPPGAARAVGQANGQNPIAILIPCHRVVQRGGGLGGYGGGLERKAWLLAHERQYAPDKGASAGGTDPAETWSGQLRLGW